MEEDIQVLETISWKPIMIIKKWIEYEKEIDISLSSEDIELIFRENSANKEQNLRIMMLNLNSIASFLKGLPDEMIEELQGESKKGVYEFLSDQAERFKR